MYTASGTKAYAQISVESGVMSASPHQVIEMLFDGANSALVRARLVLLANFRNDSHAIVEVSGLLGNIAVAWKQISPKASSQESR